MRRADALGGLVLTTLFTALGGHASAQAWAQNDGEGLIILKLEPMTAVQAFDPDGHLVPMVDERRDDTIALFGQYGLSDRFTVQVKADFQRGEDAGVSYEGAGPVEIGIVTRLHRGDRTAVSLYAGYAHGGGGRNAVWARPGQGGSDAEVRLSAGMSRPALGPLGGEAFVEVQAAVRVREALADEARVDLTAGLHLGSNWTMMVQSYIGATENRNRWLTTEMSVVRRFGRWSAQAGWRQTMLGRDTAALEGPVFALWRRF